MASNLFWKAFSLSNEHELPAISYRVFNSLDRDEVMCMMDNALSAGYRSFDMADVYGKETLIRDALTTLLPKYDLTREDIFLSSKLSNADHSNKKKVIAEYSQIETNLGTAPDLYLIQFPGSAKQKPKDKRRRQQRHLAWSAMAELYDTGRVDSIGVANFSTPLLQDLLHTYHSDIPVVNQVEWHPLAHDDELLRYCRVNAIQLQGNHSLGGTEPSGTLMKHAAVKSIADDHSASEAQVLFTWALQSGVAVNSKSKSISHIKENISLDFELTTEEFEILNNLSPPNSVS